MRYTYSYIVEFRGGTYCCQVEAEDFKASLQGWLTKINDEKSEIKYLGNKTLEEIANQMKDEDAQPVLLNGLKNIWYTSLSTSQGILYMYIVQTDISKWKRQT